MAFKTIVADPPWEQPLSNARQRSKGGAAEALPYPTMSLEAICDLPVWRYADWGCHLWLWTTNAFLADGFKVMKAWGFRYLAPIHWVKPSGMGNYVIHRTQTILLGYRKRCAFNKVRYFPNVIQTGDPVRHSQKPEESYQLIESVSHEPRLEMFARQRRPGWSVWGNEVESDVEIA